ncbi:MAG TPA: translation initiation factor IF-2 subunit gamma, partial [Thermoprotei archaeon]|nr:translation initiation factor IF-2 subunit gamma [Thermoprotei archaeon]
EELKRGITLKLGYADTAILKCPKCPPPQCYTSIALSPKGVCKYCNTSLEFLRRISFVDVPGHEMLMATMIAGSTLMDGVVFVIDASEPCPQPQTKEHFAALTIMGIKNIVIVQNKIDIVSKEKVIENYNQILKFIEGTWAEGAPIIPVSALHKVNVDAVIEALEECIPTPKRDPTLPPRMLVARSFDVNKPGTKPEELKGGVLGGTIIQGKFRIGDEIEIRPGVRVLERGKARYEPLFTEIVSLKSGEIELDEAMPGGLIGVGTLLDPSLTKADALIGSVAGKPGTLPPVWISLELDVHLLERVVGLAQEKKVEKIKVKEPLMLNAGTATTLGIVTSVSEDLVSLILRKPICAEKGSRVAISRQVYGRWRLVGYGIIK